MRRALNPHKEGQYLYCLPQPVAKLTSAFGN
nr:MAG TPA: hypothetical protein [Caudoviricetes sp.]